VAKKREHIEAEALRLPREERARLAEALISSLDEESEIEKAWSAEIKRRLQDLRSGAVQSIPADEVFAELDDLLKSR
jgi:putative addiction module component (TIGR02574 family)